MNTWFKQIADIFDPKAAESTSSSTLAAIHSSAPGSRMRGERKVRFFQCASVLLSIQLRDLLMRSISSFVALFSDRRKLPRIEMELVLMGNKITFSPSIQEVLDMIVSVVSEVRFLVAHNMDFHMSYVHDI